MKVALLGLLYAVAANGAAAGNSRPFALQPFLSKARGGAASKTLPKNTNEEEGLPTAPKIGIPLSQQAALTDKETPLIEDIQLLSDILAETVKRVSPKIHDIYTEFRALGLTR